MQFSNIVISAYNEFSMCTDCFFVQNVKTHYVLVHHTYNHFVGRLNEFKGVFKNTELVRRLMRFVYGTKFFYSSGVFGKSYLFGV